MGIIFFVYKVIGMLNVIDFGCDVVGYIDFWKEYLVSGDDDCDDIWFFVSWWKKYFLEIFFSEGVDIMMIIFRFIFIFVG